MIKIKTLVQVVGSEFSTGDADGELEIHLNKGYEVLNIVISEAETIYHEDDAPEVSFTRVITLKYEMIARTHPQGVPQGIVDAYEAYLKANDDDSVSMDEFRDVRMALIDAVGDAVNAQLEVQS